MNKESKKFNIDSDKRWAHMVVHSMLHLQGYDHMLKRNKDIMEKKEIYLMNLMGFLILTMKNKKISVFENLTKIFLKFSKSQR